MMELIKDNNGLIDLDAMRSDAKNPENLYLDSVLEHLAKEMAFPVAMRLDLYSDGITKSKFVARTSAEYKRFKITGLYDGPNTLANKYISECKRNDVPCPFNGIELIEIFKDLEGKTYNTFTEFKEEFKNYVLGVNPMMAHPSEKSGTYTGSIGLAISENTWDPNAGLNPPLKLYNYELV